MSIKGFRLLRNPFFLPGPMSVPCARQSVPSFAGKLEDLGHAFNVTMEIHARLALDPVRLNVERATEEMLRAKKG